MANPTSGPTTSRENVISSAIKRKKPDSRTLTSSQHAQEIISDIGQQMAPADFHENTLSQRVTAERGLDSIKQEVIKEEILNAEGNPKRQKVEKMGEPPTALELSSSISSTIEHDPYFDHNVNSICSFPNEEGVQLKSFNGKLDRADGLFWFYNRATGTDLKSTVLVVQKTFQTAHERFERLYNLLQDDLPPNSKSKILGVITEAYKKESALFGGLNNFKIVYNKRYPSGHDGLTELNELYQNSERIIQEHKQQLNGISKNLVDPQEIELQNYAKDIENSAYDLKAYCLRFSPKVSHDKAISMILQGQQLMRRIFNEDNCIPSQSINGSQEELSCITWFLMYCALQKKQGFYEGSFILEEDEKLFNFTKASPTIANRPCSHFEGRPHDTWYEVGVNSDLMPAEKGTILFGLVDPFLLPSKILFFKPENSSVTASYTDWLKHVQEYMVSRYNKFAYPGSDDLPGMYKERVPHNAKMAFEELIRYLQKNIKSYRPVLHSLLLTDLESALRQASLWGIGYMYRFVTSIERELPSPELKKILETLKGTWESFDNLENRTGREVYINKNELKEFIEKDLSF